MADIPKLPDQWVGNYISIQRCPECGTLWVHSPFEPYLGFPYMVIWEYTVVDFESVHAWDGGTLIHEWLMSEIRFRMKWAQRSDQEAYKRHDRRSYSHYRFDHFEHANAVDISPYLISTR